MSRIRTIKPEFWVSEQVLACSLNARLLFIGLWNFCDDHGIHPASHVRLKAEVFPGDNFSIAEIKNWINELVKKDLVQEYVVNNSSYWVVTGWKKHQRIDKPTFRYPLPQPTLQKIDDYSANPTIMLENFSMSSCQIGNETSATERNGKEGNGEDIDVCEVGTSHVDTYEFHHNAITQLFEYWQRTMNHPCAKLDKKRKRAIDLALKLNYTVSELKKAIDGCKNTPYNMGKNDSGQVYDDISLIFRDAEHIERFINNANNSPNEMEIKNNIMSGVL